jgi:hypothetical protein
MFKKWLLLFSVQTIENVALRKLRIETQKCFVQHVIYFVILFHFVRIRLDCSGVSAISSSFQLANVFGRYIAVWPLLFFLDQQL